ncbi:MAG: ACT domain-containing protein [Deltaproteobacteria bacterium]|nr:ACT domain-containing protein [Deltaproteobacteria bacterium]
MPDASCNLELLPGLLTICRLPPGEPVPDWAWGGDFAAVVRTPAELSIVCPEGRPPAGARQEPGWRALAVAGPLDFHQVGVLASLAGPLAAAEVSIFVVSTFDTDYLLLRARDLPRALAALAGAGHRISQPAGEALHPA